MAAGAIWHCCLHPDNEALFVRAGAIRPLVKLMSGNHDWVGARSSAAGALHAIASTDDRRRNCLDEGVIQPLMEMIERHDSSEVRSACCLAIALHHEWLCKRRMESAGLRDKLISCLSRRPCARYAASALVAIFGISQLEHVATPEVIPWLLADAK